MHTKMALLGRNMQYNKIIFVTYKVVKIAMILKAEV